MKKTLLILGAVILLVFGYWTISPFFINKQVSEEFPETTSEEVQVAVVSQGSFEGFDRIHYGSGDVKLVKVGDEYIVRFEDNVNVANGPDLFVGFGKDGQYVKGTELGKLKGNVGSQNYVVPADFDVSQYNEVWVWCRVFSVGFAKAVLVPGN